MTKATRLIEGEGDLLQYFVDGETEPAQWMVGTEHEKIGLLADSLERIPYEGERGIGVLLERIASRDSWERVFEGENVIALEKDGASITLEPGGQLELSGAPLRTTRETCAEFNAHVDLLKDISADMGVLWLGIGHDPLHTVDEIPRMPKARYDIMRNYLPTRGGLALHMMHATATVQANFDYASEADMVAKFRTAMAVTPIVTAMFANSSFSLGKENGFASRRADIWRDTDPDRCGMLEFIFERDFGYRDYLEWALDVPMFFIVRDHRYIDATRLTFRQFMAEGLDGERATMGDFDSHLTTLFPEVRLKHIIEVRGADAASRELICALPAVWKGILYDPDGLEAAAALVAGVSSSERHEGLVDISRRGLSAQYAGRGALEWARELLDISARGLRAIENRGETAPGETAFLDPLFEIVERGRSPGEELVARFRSEWNGSIERLIESAKY
ncbi:MAG: glutamate--cysteine ligase [Myxococcota bacterium]|nr:glutamate--cysteine ligase [Myxococcota bacterium]